MASLRSQFIAVFVLAACVFFVAAQDSAGAALSPAADNLSFQKHVPDKTTPENQGEVVQQVTVEAPAEAPVDAPAAVADAGAGSGAADSAEDIIPDEDFNQELIVLGH